MRCHTIVQVVAQRVVPRPACASFHTRLRTCMAERLRLRVRLPRRKVPRPGPRSLPQVRLCRPSLSLSLNLRVVRLVVAAVRWAVAVAVSEELQLQLGEWQQELGLGQEQEGWGASKGGR